MAPLSNDLISKIINDAVQFAVNIANNNIHGYSMTTRSLYNMNNPSSFDCSSLICTSWQYAFEKNGITELTPKSQNCSWTGNIIGENGNSGFLNCGFEIVARNQTAHAQMVKGDIELNIIHHVAMAIDSNNIVHARSSEGTTDTIDNSGNEIRTQPWYLYSHGWDCRIRFTGSSVKSYVPNDSIKENSTSNNQIWKGDLNYYLENNNVGKWQNAMNVGFDAIVLEVDNKFGEGSQLFAKTHILWSGQTHNCPTAIRWLQSTLKTYGFNKIVVDGKWSDYLTTCVKVFQKNRGILADGEVGLITTYWLLSGIMK